MTSQSSEGGFNVDFEKIKKIVVSIATDPKNNWPSVQGEYGSIKSIYLNFMLPLMAFQAVVTALHSSFVGINIPMYGVQKVPLQNAIIQGIIALAVSCLMSYIASIVLWKLASKFQGNTDQTRALRLVAFTASLGWIGSVLLFVPIVGMLGQIVLAVYSVYIFYQGVPTMTGVPHSERLKYVAISVVSMIVIGFIVMAILGPLMVLGGGAMMM